MNRKITMLMVSLLAGLPCAVHAQSVIASHAGSTNQGGLGREFAAPANQFNHAWGQTFTATASGYLTAVTVNLAQADPSLDLRMDFYDYTANPTLSSRLATLTLPAASLGGGFHDVTFDFSGAGVSLAASNVYAFVMSTAPTFNPPTTGNEDMFEDYYFNGTSDASYAGGSAFYDFNYNNAGGTSSGSFNFLSNVVDTNFSVTAIPEPSTNAALAGLAGLALVLSRRLRQRTA